MTKRGSLIVLGAGIKSVAHITLEARGWIEQADIVLYCLAESGTEQWIRENARESRNLSMFYGSCNTRTSTYKEMAETALRYVRAGFDTCMVFYGHAGVFVQSTHLALSMAHAEGFPAAMLPGISALDCLFADLEVEQSTTGFQSMGATDLLLRRRRPQTDSHVVIWQIGFVGNTVIDGGNTRNQYLPLLLEYLGEFYPPDHPVTVYEASQYPVASARKDRMMLCELVGVPLNLSSTLYLPPHARSEVDPEMAERLGFRTAVSTGETSAQPCPGARTISEANVPPAMVAARRSSLGVLMASLAGDPGLLAQFNRNPKATAGQHGLSVDEIETALTRSSLRIHRAIANGSANENQAMSNAPLPAKEGSGDLGLFEALPR